MPELNAATRLRASVHNVFPQGGGTLWRHTPKEDRLEILRKYPHRTDLDLNAPYEGDGRPPVPYVPAVRPSSGIRAPKHGYLDLTLPQED